MFLFARIQHNDATFFKSEYYNMQFIGKNVNDELRTLEELKFDSPYEAMALLGERDFNLCDTVYLSGGIGYRHIWMSKQIEKE